ncbi:MAG: sulfatase [Lentisphaerae bacterium]|nr:sulfatase [Lentisphaerota bacterium]
MNQPNVIIMLMDNLGYGDLGCYGSRQHRTPQVDGLARQGLRFTSFYSTSGVCTPSRASLMTGCYPRRINMHVAGRGQAVLMPIDPKGLNPGEITLARLLKAKGYATACIGKWHLGDQLPFLPTRHGFDRFFGCPYSEDMVPTAFAPDRPPLPLMRGEKVVEAPAERDTLTRRYTEEAISFIRENADRPFFLYLAQAMPGSTERPFASPAFQGRSANGPYGDAVEELDWSCGQIMQTLAELDLDEKTLVLWTSDNGAVRWDPPQGSNAPLRGWGYDTSEGGQRVPCIARWPGRVPANVIDDRIVTMMDVLPTVARLAGADTPADRIIDGHDIRPILQGNTVVASPYDDCGFFYYYMHQLQAVRSGPWKLYLALDRKLRNLQAETKGCSGAAAELYNLRDDISETREVSAQYPEVVARLLALAGRARADLGDLGRDGANQRPAGWVASPQPCVRPG